MPAGGPIAAGGDVVLEADGVGFRDRVKCWAFFLPGLPKPVARSAYSLRFSRTGMVILRLSFERITGPQA